MPVPTLLTDLSATIASNSPAGSDNVFPDLDGYLRSLSGFLASIRDNSGNGWVSPYLTAANPSYTGTLTGGTGVVNLGSGQFYKSATGNVGIGTISPTALLDVNGNITTAATARIGYIAQTDTASIAGVTVANYGFTVGATFTGFSAPGTMVSGYGGVLFATAGLERARIDNAGNLGLGVTPSAWTGSGGNNIEFGAAGNAIFGSTSATTYTSNANFDSSWKYSRTGFASRYEQQDSVHRWYTAPSGTAGNPITFTQSMTLTNAGELLLGTTTSAASDTNSILVNPSAKQMAVQHATGTTTGTNYINFLYAAGSIGNITQSGTTAVLYNTTSDQRLKTNIVDAPDAAALIDSIQVRSFDWISDDSHQRYGMVAQELFEVAPEAVHAPTDPDAMMAVDYSKLVPMLVKEIQSLRARVAALEA